MKPHAILSNDPFDLLFEYRNKKYGAYTLRKYYPRRLLISLAANIPLVVLSSLFCWYNRPGARNVSHSTSQLSIVNRQLFVYCQPLLNERSCLKKRTWIAAPKDTG
jgi:hypothetical protein